MKIILEPKDYSDMGNVRRVVKKQLKTMNLRYCSGCHTVLHNVNFSNGTAKCKTCKAEYYIQKHESNPARLRGQWRVASRKYRLNIKLSTT